MSVGFRNSPVATELKVIPEIYLGIDFGTTFTKVSYRIGAGKGSKIRSILAPDRGRFLGEEMHCIPSKVWYDPQDGGALSFQPDPNLNEVKYFKYGMIEPSILRTQHLEWSRECLSNDIMRLCSAFYLANLIDYVKSKIVYSNESFFKVYAEDTIRWYVNMGVPVSDFDSEQRSVYDEVLNVAWSIANDDVAEMMGLAELDGMYNTYKDQHSNRLKTVPELFAESLMIWQSSRFDTGFYTIIDIGGGTTDIALFYKKIDSVTGKISVSCVSQDVRPLGYEMFRMDERRVIDDFSLSYSKTFCDARDVEWIKKAMKRCAEDSRNHLCFFMGGARKVRNYIESIASVFLNHNQGFYLQSDIVDDADMIALLEDRDTTVMISDNPRLLISQMLCQPHEKIPELDGLPWHYKPGSFQRDFISLEDVQTAIYGTV